MSEFYSRYRFVRAPNAGVKHPLGRALDLSLEGQTHPRSRYIYIGLAQLSRTSAIFHLQRERQLIHLRESFMADFMAEMVAAQGVTVYSAPNEFTAPFYWYGVKCGRRIGLFKRL